MGVALLVGFFCFEIWQKPVYVANSRVRESSGVAVSRRYSGVYWTHNDSGDGPHLYAFDSRGKDLGVFTLKGAQALDWEDMAAMEHNGKPFLYVGDIGDNLKIRKEIRVYCFEEPRLSQPHREIEKHFTYRFRYPDGSWDAEALLVTPHGSIEIVTKEIGGKARIYRCDRPKEGDIITLRW
ncbi:MAG: hypothetical protein K6T17_04685, partial [Fimbriimonadales bacterium]|nr:hypothetical protein [Fimbriimonadales bacterium]